MRKFGKIRYISNLLDFFGRNNFELTKKKSFTRVSSQRKRLQTQQVCKAPRTLGIWDFKFACFLTINSLKATYMHTFEDIKRIFISESGIEQVLKCTEIVISSITYLWLLNHVLTVADYCHWFPLLKASKRNDHNFAGELITRRHDCELKKYGTQAKIDANAPSLGSQLSER